MTLPFEVLLPEHQIWCSDLKTAIPIYRRYSNGLPQNSWERALVFIQENPPSLSLDPSSNILNYCAAHMLLSVPHLLVNTKDIEDWYIFLDDIRSPLFPKRTLGQWRTMYSIKWLHAHGVNATPLDCIWFSNQYWPTHWEGTTLEYDLPLGYDEYNRERWSFRDSHWHIQNWFCTKNENEIWSIQYQSYVAAMHNIRDALTRTAQLHPEERNAAWLCIPTNIRLHSLLDWIIHNPQYENIGLPQLCLMSNVSGTEWSNAIDLARTLQTSASTLLISMSKDTEIFQIPVD